MIDENAFGALISYVTLEEDEYASEDTVTFEARVEQFRAACLDAVRERPPGHNTHAVFLGHALYVEVPEGDEKPPLVAFVRALRDRLKQADIGSAGIITHGGRWVEREDSVRVEVVEGESYRMTELSLPSEPFRKALAVDTACHGVGATEGWGQGLYLDAEALQPLGLNLKNQPTPLYVGEGVYFRVGR